jgi:hypothetical protein
VLVLQLQDIASTTTAIRQGLQHCRAWLGGQCDITLLSLPCPAHLACSAAQRICWLPTVPLGWPC